MALEFGSEKPAYYKPYNLLDFLYGILLFENPIRVEKVEKILLEYNAKFEKKLRGVNLENKPEISKYIESTDFEYRLTDGFTLETQITEGTSLFNYLFFNTKPIIYDFLYLKYYDKQIEESSFYGKIVREIKQKETDKKKPILNDLLYRNYRHKEEIDQIRLAFYEIFERDLKVVDVKYEENDNYYLNLVQHHYKFVPTSNIGGLLTNSLGLGVSFSDDIFSNGKYTSFTYYDSFREDQGFSNDYLKFCQLASNKIGGGELNLVERHLGDSIKLYHIEYKQRDNYYGPQQGQFGTIPHINMNRFIQYLASRSRYGDSKLGYIHYYDIELLTILLTEQELKIVVEFIAEWNYEYIKYCGQDFNGGQLDTEIGPKLSYIKKIL